MAEIEAMEARQAAQYGRVERIRELLDLGECTPDTLDADDCSLLHWAAINNRFSILLLISTKFFIVSPLYNAFLICYAENVIIFVCVCVFFFTFLLAIF